MKNKMVTNKNGYKLRDYVIYTCAKNREVLGLIKKFNDDDTIRIQMIISDKKSPVFVLDERDVEFSEIRGIDDLQYSLNQKDISDDDEYDDDDDDDDDK